MEYVRLTGEGGAFGWQSAQDGVWQLTLGGCAAGECLVIGEAGTRRITPDAGGAFRGDTACGRALCVAALPEGALLAYDVQRLSRQEARILCRELYRTMELCCRETEDFRQAYAYAAKQLEMEK